MKSFILVVLALFSCFSSYGQKNVKLEHIKKVSKEVYKRKNAGKDINLKIIIPIVSESKNDTLLYVVPYEGDGFAIISGIYEVSPVLGYCENGIYDPSLMPPGLLYLIDKYKYEVEKAKAFKIKASKHVENLWSDYLSDIQLKSYSIGTYLLNTTWGQESNYNQFVPSGYPAGCTAVAMAQILRYWACRIAPSGSIGSVNIGATIYNWNNMSSSSANADNALLIYHAGLSCDTNYGSSGSSSTPGKARDGFVTNWGISSNADVRSRIMHLNTWSDDLKNELNQERPILYSGGALLGGGHSWVIDGYYSNGNFHCNWGWYGTYNNGEYSLGSFDPPGDPGPYNQYESAIFNVYPVQPVGVGTPTLTNQTFTYNSNGYVITVPPAFGATAYQWVTDHGTITGTGTSANLISNCSAIVQVRAYNNRCGIYSPYAVAQVTINYGSISGPSIVCSSGATFTINNPPAGSTILWTKSSNLTEVSGQGTTSYRVKASGGSPPAMAKGSMAATTTEEEPGSSGSVQATISNSCGSITIPQKIVWAGFPGFRPVVTGPTSINCGVNTTYSEQNQQSIYWSVPGSMQIIGSAGPGYRCTIKGLELAAAGVIGTVSNACGSYSDILEVDINCSTLAVYPNPASSTIDVTITSDETGTEPSLSKTSTSTNDDVTYTVRITNNYGIPFYTTQRTGNCFSIPVDNLKDGNYIVQVTDGDHVYNQKLIVKH